MNRLLALALAAFLSAGSPAVAQSAQLKPALSGLVLMGSIEFHRHDDGVPDNSLAAFDERPGVFGGLDINLTWAQLQPRPGPIVTKDLDDALASIRDYNSRHSGTPLAAKLRVWGGPNAPEWAKTLDGPAVTVIHTIPGQTAFPLTVGRFWSDSYRRAWRDLQAQLAARYDSEPLVREVAQSSCSSMSDEPFIFPGDPESQANLRAAGYSDQAIYSCLISSVGDYSGWKTTRVEFPFNPFRRIDSGKVVLDDQATIAIMQAWRQALGERAILGNHGAQSDRPPRLAPIFDRIKQLGPPIEFQAGRPRDRDWNAAVADAIARGATEYEVWSTTGPGTLRSTATPEQLKAWAEGLHGNLSRLPAAK